MVPGLRVVTRRERIAELVRGEGIYNVVVIGGGTAGLVTAAGTAGLGGRVALIERHLMGGDCLNTGCVPSKALLASARAAQQMRDAARLALARVEPGFRFEDVMARVRERRAKIAPHDSKERFESLGVDVFLERGEIVSPHEVRAGATVLRTRHIVIATGSRAVVPPIEGLADARPFTNETIFDTLDRQPPRLAVIGGGPIGCELGQAFARLGVRVTIVQSAPQLLHREDVDAAEIVRVLRRSSVPDAGHPPGGDGNPAVLDGRLIDWQDPPGSQRSRHFRLTRLAARGSRLGARGSGPCSSSSL